MNKSKISIILLFISLAFLIIYAADEISVNKAETNKSSGFLNLDAMVRGMVLGGGSVVMSVIAFGISFKEKSRLVAILLLINGGLIVGGMIGVSMQSFDQQTNGNMEIIYVTGLGLILIGLGIAKLFINKK